MRASTRRPIRCRLNLDARHVVEDLLRAPAILGGECDEVVEPVGGVAESEEAKLLWKVVRHGKSFCGRPRVS